MKTSKITRVLCAGMTAAMMATSFTACNKTEETTTEAEETEVSETTAAETTAAETIAEATEAASQFTLPEKLVFDGDFELQVIGYEYFDTGDKYEYDILNVYYDFTSLSDRFAKVNAIYWSAPQNGEEQKFSPSSNSSFNNI